MTTVWADGFDSADINDLTYDYTLTGGSWSKVTGRRGAGTYAVQSTKGFYHVLPSPTNTVFMSFALKRISGTTTTFLSVKETGSNDHITVQITATGLVFYSDSSLRGSASFAYTNGNWIWLQFKFVVDNSAGSIECRDASGNVLVNLTGIDTRSGGPLGVVGVVTLGDINNSDPIAFDDFHVWNTTGSVCNTWTNDSRVDHLLPNGAGNSTQFTPSSGSNYQCVDDAPINTTDYVSSSTAGHQDLYTFTDLPHTPVSIFAAVRQSIATKDDSGARSLKNITRSGTTTVAGSAQTLTLGTWTSQVDVQETDPNTSAAWTVSGINAAQHGIENV